MREGIVDKERRVSDAEKTPEALFKAQMEKTSFLTIEGQSCEVFDLVPDEVSSTRPVLFVVGHGATPREYSAALFELFKQGRRVISMTPPRIQTVPESSDRKFPPALLLRAQALGSLCALKGVASVDVVAHSEGTIHAIIAAGQHEERFRNFILVAPPGFTANNTTEIVTRAILTKLQKLGLKKDVENKEPLTYTPPNTPRDVRQQMSELFRAMDPGKIDVTDDVRELHDRGHGVTIIAHIEDRMLPMKEFQKSKDGSPRDQANLGIDGFYSVIGTHDEIKMNPKIGFLVGSALTALTEKYEKEHATLETTE